MHFRTDNGLPGPMELKSIGAACEVVIPRRRELWLELDWPVD